VAPEGLGGLSVLVVDDNASNLDLLCEFLSAWGMQPTAVSSGGSALAAIKNGPLPLVLIDADLPDMNGRAVARRIKDTTEPAPAIIVMLSTRDRQGDSPRMPELGGAGLLTKPIAQADLLDAIQKVLGVLQPTENGGLRKRASSEAQFELRRWNILLAEDNSVNQLVTSRILQKRGCSVSIVSDGLEAVQTFERQHFDMILMDVRMPLMGGLEAAALIREKECSTGGRVPIVALTADATLGCREQCLNAGMDDYLSKPINPQRLLAKLDRLLLAPTDALDCQKTQQRLV
jgi:CheY-like chemotaxis protein